MCSEMDSTLSHWFLDSFTPSKKPNPVSILAPKRPTLAQYYVFLPFWPNWFGFSSPEVVLVLLESFGAFVGVGEQKVVGRMVIIAMMTIRRRRHRSSKSTFDASNRNTPEKSQDKTSHTLV